MLWWFWWGWYCVSVSYFFGGSSGSAFSDRGGARHSLSLSLLSHPLSKLTADFCKNTSPISLAIADLEIGTLPVAARCSGNDRVASTTFPSRAS